MKLPFKKAWFIPIIIVLFLLIGNPGKHQFKEFLGIKSDTAVKRKYNFLIFSIWVEKGGNCDDVYFAAAFNFFKTGYDC